MRVRDRLVAGDRPAILRIVTAVGNFRPAEVAVAMELVDLGLSEDDRGYRFAVALGAAESDEVLGYASYGQAPMTDAVYELYWIAVDPAWQGRGVGRALLHTVERSVAACGGRMLLIDTESSDGYAAARRLYSAAGFTEEARIRDYYYPGVDKVTFGRKIS
jgi:ribosomal protein S18 acetylase RimI-like enzyme